MFSFSSQRGWLNSTQSLISYSSWAFDSAFCHLRQVPIHNKETSTPRWSHFLHQSSMCGWFKGIFKVKINDHHCPPRGFSLHVDTGPSEVVLKRCDFLWPRPCSFHPEGELGEHALHCAFHRKWTKCSIKSCYRKVDGLAPAQVFPF